MPHAPLVLAIDQGTHATRAAVFDATGEIRAQALRAVAIHTPRDGWVEQDPAELVASVRAVLAAIAAQLGVDGVEAVVSAGLATQRASIVCWDRTSGEALTPLLSWQDTRAADWLARFEPHAREIGERTGLRLSPHYGASKLRWCLDHVPAVRAACQQTRLVAGPWVSYLLHQLLENHPTVCDPGNGSRTLLWNLRRRRWDPMLLALFGIPKAILPVATASRGEFGQLRLGNRRVPMTWVMGDQPAALFAQGPPAADTLYVNLGTGAFLLRPVPATAPTDTPSNLLLTTVCADAQAITLALEGTVNGAGRALRDFAIAYGVTDVEQRLPRWLREIDAPPLFLNGVGGLGSPLWRPAFPSQFSGDGSVAAHAVAVIESIVFLLRLNLDAMRSMQPEIPARILASGGLSHLDGLCQRLADLCETPVWRTTDHEASARGLAYLQQTSTADWRPQPTTLFQPTHAPALQDRYRRWRELMLRAAGVNRGF